MISHSDDEMIMIMAIHDNNVSSIPLGDDIICGRNRYVVDEIYTARFRLLPFQNMSCYMML